MRRLPGMRCVLSALALVQCAGRAMATQDTAARPFTFLIGAYPSKGLIEYRLDCARIAKESSGAAWSIAVERDGRVVVREHHALPAGGVAQGYLFVGKMPDGARYTLTAVLTDRSGRDLGRESDEFVRHVVTFTRNAVVRFGTAPALAAPDQIPYTAYPVP